MPKLSSLGEPLPPEFFLQPTLAVAESLIGCRLYFEDNHLAFLVRLVEVEAYLSDDPASHSYRGITPRSAVMFKPGGTCYVYLSYGINYCMNVVTGKAGTGEAVLLRAAEPIWGEPMMAQRRNLALGSVNLCNGPGKLTQALGIDLRQNGRSLLEPDFCLLPREAPLEPQRIITSPRIGISKAVERPFRFFLSESKYVSRGRSQVCLLNSR